MLEPSAVLPRVLRRGLHNEALALAKAGAVDEALERELAALALDSSNVESLVVTGKLYAQKSMYSQAIQCWEAALSLDPTNARARAGIERATMLQAPRQVTPRVRKLAPFSFVPVCAIAVLALVVTGHWPYSSEVVQVPTVSSQRPAFLAGQGDASAVSKDGALDSSAPARVTVGDTPEVGSVANTLSAEQQNVTSPAPAQAPASVAAIPSSAAPQPVAASATTSSEAGPVADRSQAATEHVVRWGETLARIAAQDYGDWRSWRDIFEANRDQVSNPNYILPGQVLRIPR